MTAASGILRRSLRMACVSACIAGSAIVAQAWPGTKVFSPVNVRKSTNGASVLDPDTFGTASLNLSCPSAPIVAVLSSTSDGKSNVLVDNYITLTVTRGSTTTGPFNLCGTTAPGSNPASCFNSVYQNAATAGQLTGQDPDGTIAASGGLPPIDIHQYLEPGANEVTFNLVDFGGYLTSTSIYLATNCTPTGVSGNGKVSGNPISSTNPTASELTQPFTFSSIPDKNVELLLDLSTASTAGTLDITNGVIPTVTDQAFDPALWPSFVKGTSFATSQCLIHNGELLDGSPACKLYTLTCQIGQGSESSGVQCPTSSARNIVLQDVFDFPPLSLPDIIYIEGNFSETFHQGFGFLEASEGWTGGACTFDPAADQMFSCPENLLTVFSGPGLGKSTGTPSPSVNSEFISVGPVPEYRTHVDLSPWSANHIWVNSHNVTATFNTRAPILPADFNGGNLNDFKAAPLYGVTYGVAPLAGYPSTPSTEFPVPGDKTLLYQNGNGCEFPPPTLFEWPSVQLTVSEDGMYLVHFFATDCAGTEELYFQQDNTGAWFTTFYTAVMFVDTVKPKVVAGPDLSPQPALIGTELGYCQNQKVKATYQCSDDFSGVAVCATASYSNPVTNPPPVVAGVDTSTLGTHMYTVHVTDAAGNQGKPESVAYTVFACP